jgi:hypothetical protein
MSQKTEENTEEKKTWITIPTPPLAKNLGGTQKKKKKEERRIWRRRKNMKKGGKKREEMN